MKLWSLEVANPPCGCLAMSEHPNSLIDTEVVCREIAQALCRTHLECIEQSEVKEVAEKHKCLGRAKNKDNMVLNIVRALNFAGMRTDEDLFGLTTKYEPF